MLLRPYLKTVKKFFLSTLTALNLKWEPRFSECSSDKKDIFLNNCVIS